MIEWVDREMGEGGVELEGEVSISVKFIKKKKKVLVIDKICYLFWWEEGELLDEDAGSFSVLVVEIDVRVFRLKFLFVIWLVVVLNTLFNFF